LATDDILRLDDVVAGYGKETILHGLSFSVPRGAITTVIGPNGAGKSTAFKASFGMLPVRSGRIFFDGREITNRGPRQLIADGICYVPQGRNIFPELSVLHNLELGGVAAPRGFDLERRMQAAMERFPVLRRKAGAQASTLSGGEQKMLEIARGLMLEPKLMLIDEPSIGLSPILVEELFGLLRDLRVRGISVLMIEQNAKRALDNSDYGIVLELGRTRIQDRAATILADPRIGQLFLGGGLEPVAGDVPSPPSSPYVANVGERTMNAVASRNMKFVSHSDLSGRGDGVQIMVHRGYAYVGHGFSNGITTVDVRDAKHPKVVDFIACPPGTRAFHLQTHDDLLLAVNAPSVWTMQEFQNEKAYFGGSPADKLKDQSRFTAGIRVYDISKPEKPAEIGFMPVEGLGPHRIWYTGGRYAYASIHFADFTDHIFAVIDMSDPRKPHVVGRWWLPGMWRAGGETPTWRAGKRYALHHGLVTGNLAYAAWRDGGLTVLDVADPANPKLVVHRNTDPPFGGGTHSPLPLPDRNLLVLADEPTSANCSEGLRYIWMFDIREPSNPVSIATCPQPSEANYCAKGGNFGPHNLHENRPGAFQSSRLIFATYYNAGVRAYDIENPFQPREVGFYVPPNPERMIDPRPNRPQVIQSCDCYVDRNGLMYLTDPNAGLNILQFEGELAS
jgi:ABC-type branched-subunit amino acid transport system ATPase component